MAYFTGAAGQLPPRFAAGVRLRVDNGGTYLGSITSFIQSRYPSVAPKPASAPAPLPLPAWAPTPSAPAPAPIPTFSPVSKVPTAQPVYNPPPPPPPSSQPFDAPPPPAQDTGAGAVAAAAAPIVGAINPAAGAAAALLPAFTQAAGAPDTGTQIRFNNDGVTDGALPDMSLPEVYNPDGTPVTPAAKAATLAEKIKALPVPAKVGGAVLLYLFFARR